MEYLGTITDPVKGAQIYDMAAMSLGRAPANFPESDYDPDLVARLRCCDTWEQRKALLGIKLRAITSRYAGSLLQWHRHRAVSCGPADLWAMQIQRRLPGQVSLGRKSDGPGQKIQDALRHGGGRSSCV